MIVLDTSVVSEAMKPSPDAAVLSWLDAQVAETLFLSSVTVAELLFGIEAMPQGRRKQALSDAVAASLALFSGRILPFDEAAARSYARLAVRARVAGRGFPVPDGCIAAIAATRGFAVATRDASAFSAAGLGAIDPWRGVA